MPPMLQPYPITASRFFSDNARQAAIARSIKDALGEELALQIKNNFRPQSLSVALSAAIMVRGKNPFMNWQRRCCEGANFLKSRTRFAPTWIKGSVLVAGEHSRKKSLVFIHRKRNTDYLPSSEQAGSDQEKGSSSRSSFQRSTGTHGRRLRASRDPRSYRLVHDRHRRGHLSRSADGPTRS